MPRFDRTGPEGRGSRTGRCLGLCGDGRAFRRSRRQIRRFDRKDEVEFLEDRLDELEAEKEEIEKSLEEVK